MVNIGAEQAGRNGQVCDSSGAEEAETLVALYRVVVTGAGC
jgi:hypothetical protein